MLSLAKVRAATGSYFPLQPDSSDSMLAVVPPRSPHEYDSVSIGSGNPSSLPLAPPALSAVAASPLALVERLSRRLPSAFPDRFASGPSPPDTTVTIFASQPESSLSLRGKGLFALLCLFWRSRWRWLRRFFLTFRAAEESSVTKQWCHKHRVDGRCRRQVHSFCFYRNRRKMVLNPISIFPTTLSGKLNWISTRYAMSIVRFAYMLQCNSIVCFPGTLPQYWAFFYLL